MENRGQKHHRDRLQARRCGRKSPLWSKESWATLASAWSASPKCIWRGRQDRPRVRRGRRRQDEEARKPGRIECGRGYIRHELTGAWECGRRPRSFLCSIAPTNTADGLTSCCKD